MKHDSKSEKRTGTTGRRRPDLRGAAIIDENGTERPITEPMVQEALDALDHAWRRQRAARGRRMAR